MDYVKAFVVGGIICVLAQILMDKTKLLPGRIMVILVCTGVVLGALGIYKPLLEFAQCGASVPLTGFGYNLWKKIMKLNINIDAEAKEPEIMITTAQMTEEVNRVVDFVSRLDDAPTIISGIREDKVELLDPDHIVKIYAEDSKVFTQTDNGTYQIRLRLYEAEERLDNSKFVRISNSEIVNLKKVKSLDLSFVGTICMELSNGTVSYVSRRYVSKIKKVLGL